MLAPLLLASLVIWVVTVLVVMALCARLSGWKLLAEAYPCPGDCPRPRLLFGSLVFRNWFGYNNGVIVSADERALHLTAWPVILAPTHAPIAVPWSEIAAVRHEKRWFGECWEVQTRRLPELRWALRRRAYERARPFIDRHK